MLNWPGAGVAIGCSTGSRLRVTVSAVSRARPTTRYGTGTMASAARTSAGSARTIDVEHPHADGLEPSQHDLGKPLHQQVSEVRIRVALGAQADPVECTGRHGVACLGVELPLVGLEQPGPAQHIAAIEGVDDHPAPARHIEAEGDAAAAQDIEGVGRLPLGEDPLSRPVVDVAAAARDESEAVLVQALEEGLLGDEIGDRLHGVAPAGWRVSPSVARIADTSSVMSMPTGHRAIPRPPPTHPEVPNWSYQVASLWVIHCRYRDRVVHRIEPPWSCEWSTLKQDAQVRCCSAWSGERLPASRKSRKKKIGGGKRVMG